MAMAKEMMGGGLSAGTARAINGGQNLTVSAAGSTISDATELRCGHNVVTTITAGQGVKLPSDAEIGDSIYIYNATSGTSGVVLTVYPMVSSQTINQLAAGTGALLAPSTSIQFRRASTTAWTGVLSA